MRNSVEFLGETSIGVVENVRITDFGGSVCHHRAAIFRCFDGCSDIQEYL